MSITIRIPASSFADAIRGADPFQSPAAHSRCGNRIPLSAASRAVARYLAGGAEA